MVSLSRENLVVVGAELHAGSSPSIEELAGIDGAAGAVVVTDGPVLLEGLGAVDCRSVDTSALVKLVGSSVHGDLTARLASRAL